MPNIKEKLARMLEQTIAKIGGFGVPRSDARRMAVDLIQQGVTIPEWISVEDRLPEAKTEVLVYTGTSVFSHTFFAADSIITSGITHWMPMPMPPKGE